VEFYDHIDEFAYCPGIGENPSFGDPLPRWSEMEDRRLDSFTSIKSASISLANVLGITICAMSTYLHLLIVEMAEKDYHLDPLPGMVGGRITLWAVYGTLWAESIAQSHAKGPRSSSGDDTDYIPLDLCPGIKVCGTERSELEIRIFDGCSYPGTCGKKRCSLRLGEAIARRSSIDFESISKIVIAKISLFEGSNLRKKTIMDGGSGCEL
jgi:hypothetical protein